jgi:ATP-dependent Clp protease ATP-binding subunit ClpC
MTETKSPNLTPRAKKAFKRAKEFAVDNYHMDIDSAHLFYGCLSNLSEDLVLTLENNEISSSPLDYKDLLLKFFDKNPKDYKKDFEQDFKREEIDKIISYAQKLSEIYEHDYIGIEHLTYATLENSEKLCSFLTKEKIDVENFKALIKKNIENILMPSQKKEKVSEEKPHQTASVNERKKIKPLELYCSLLNEDAIAGKFNKISGRDKEIDELIEIISKRSKSNAVLIGESGVGKTAIVEGLAQRIVSQNVPSNLLSLQIYSVDLTSMISGTKYRGEFEERLKQLISVASKYENIVLFFDEIHNIIGAGSNAGTLDAANILKPALARGELKCIGATTASEYKKYFEKDSAIKRRFDPIFVSVPSAEKTKEIVSNCIDYYESFHNVKYESEIIQMIVNLCEKYIPHKNFPDKAFDMIDSIGAKVKIKNRQIPEEIKSLQAYLLETLYALDDEVNPEEDEYCKNLLVQYVAAMGEFNEYVKNQVFEITKSDVVEVFSEKTSLSKESISTDNSEFLHFQKNIEQEVFGQSENIKEITDILSCAKVGLNDNNKPLASLFFVGPTSVGKTHTAKKIAKYFFGNEQSFIQINMSEYQDKSGINKLIGASVGYIGSDQGGILTEFVKNNPNCVVLFDEAEKCDPDILNLLLHLLDEGYVNDNLNNKISFNKSIVIFTSNVGHENKDKVSMGFVNDFVPQSDVYREAIKRHLKPEFIARVDAILVFNELKDKEYQKIISKEISEIENKLKQQNIKISFGDGVVEFILNSLKIEKLHARNIKEIVKSKIQIPISKFIIQNPEKSDFSVNFVDNTINIH